MELSQYMHEQSLRGYIADNNYVIQLNELSSDGNIINTYYYHRCWLPNSHIKLMVLPKAEKVDCYKYAMKTEYGLYMFLLIHDRACYDFTYKIYDLDNETFIWHDLTLSDLLYECRSQIYKYAHNRLFRLIAEKNFAGEFAQQQFQKIKRQFNEALQLYINNHFITSDKPALSKIDSANYSLLKNLSSTEAERCIKQYNNLYLIRSNNLYYVVKFSTDGKQYIICQFTDKSFKVKSYVQWQLNYSILSHIIDTNEYKYLSDNIENIYTDFTQGIDYGI